MFENQSIRRTFYVEEVAERIYQVKFEDSFSPTSYMLYYLGFPLAFSDFAYILLITVIQVTFTPTARGKHRVYVYLHGMEVKGSPFSLRIGKDVREPRKPATDIFKADRKVSRYVTFL